MWLRDAHIVLKETIDLLVAVAKEAEKAQKNVAFKHNAPFRSYISKISFTLVENVENLDIVMLIYNLSEYSQNYSMTSGSLWTYDRDEIDNVNDGASDGKSFEYKTEVIWKAPQTPAWPGTEGNADR